MILLIFLQTESAFDFKPLAKALFIKRNKKKRKNLLAKVCWCSSGRLAEKAPRITEKLAQLVGKWVRPACAQWRDATKGVPNAVNRGRNAGMKGQNTIWKGRNAFNGERNANKIWRPAIAQWRDATKGMPNAVKRGQNAGTEGQNAIWRGRNTILDFSISTAWFCAFQYLLGRTAIFMDKLPICSSVLGRTTVSRDKRRFGASTSNDRRLAEKEPQITRKLAQLVGKGGRPAFDERRDAANAMRKAVNRGRNAGTEGQNTIWRGRNTEIRDQLPIYSTVPGRTTVNRDEFSFCTFFFVKSSFLRHSSFSPIGSRSRKKVPQTEELCSELMKAY
ncbi:hypothetical protein QT327_25970 [Olivibacter sp. 47]|uniref:hypothetical protein n=1 Tax=Olivibacter sp. 47 TaxID=3056486 RepID=UPI0025A36D17|nr:hypothetical protein [Olivibacter sp. 47]MDM8177756.1 hypothetical protein [Olivibacter sp. 47]